MQFHLELRNNRWRASAIGRPDWCVGFGASRADAVYDLLMMFSSTLGVSITTGEQSGRPEPLDGLCAANVGVETGYCNTPEILP